MERSHKFMMLFHAKTQEILQAWPKSLPQTHRPMQSISHFRTESLELNPSFLRPHTHGLILYSTDINFSMTLQELISELEYTLPIKFAQDKPTSFKLSQPKQTPPPGRRV